VVRVSERAQRLQWIQDQRISVNAGDVVSQAGTDPFYGLEVHKCAAVVGMSVVVAHSLEQGIVQRACNSSHWRRTVYEADVRILLVRLEVVVQAHREAVIRGDCRAESHIANVTQIIDDVGLVPAFQKIQNSPDVQPRSWPV